MDMIQSTLLKYYKYNSSLQWYIGEYRRWFDSNTYTFTCPIQGRYILSAGFHTNGNNSYAVDLKINNQSHDTNGRAGTGASGNSKKFIVAIAVLNVGDTVYVECVSGSIRLFGQNISRFYGCLLEWTIINNIYTYIYTHGYDTKHTFTIL